MTAPAKLVAYLANAAEVWGGRERHRPDSAHDAIRDDVEKAGKVIVRRMTKDAKRIEELEAALGRVLSEANHTLNRDPRKGTGYVASLGAMKDYAEAALKRGPYAKRKRA